MMQTRHQCTEVPVVVPGPGICRGIDQRSLLLRDNSLDKCQRSAVVSRNGFLRFRYHDFRVREIPSNTVYSKASGHSNTTIPRITNKKKGDDLDYYSTRNQEKRHAKCELPPVFRCQAGSISMIKK